MLMALRCALVVSEKGRRRRLLIQAIQQSGLYGQLCVARTLPQGIEFLRGDRFDTIFLGCEFDCEEVAEFSEALRATLVNEKSQCVLIVGEDGADLPSVAKYMVVGVHSFVCEPYSIQSVSESTDLARKVQDRGSRARLKAAAGIILQDALKEMYPEVQSTLAVDVNLWREIQHAYAHFKKLTGYSLTSPVVTKLQKLKPVERARRYARISEGLRHLLSSQITALRTMRKDAPP